MEAALWGAILIITATVLTIVFCVTARARDDGRYANSPLKPWFQGLKANRGLCCDGADGQRIDDSDWSTTASGYRVRIEGEWHDVPKDALIEEPNLAGFAMVWYYNGAQGIYIRCFLRGNMT